MTNTNYIAVYDFETTSKNGSKAQLTQISCIMIDPRKLEFVDSSLFDIDVKPIFDEEKCLELEIDAPTQEVLDKTHKTREALEKAPDPKQAWEAFVSYIKKYYKGKNSWTAPIRAGYNIIGYDNPIVDRMCKQFGPYDDEYKCQNLFHPLHNIDVMNFVWMITENLKINSTNSVSFDNVREWLGMSKDGAHNAAVDVIDAGELVIRIMKLFRKLNSGIDCINPNCGTKNRVKFEKSLSSWKRPLL